jgi:2',3'-cyclic-nucleotide 2'-phosphodiesterase (5'-nucleotidase family)
MKLINKSLAFILALMLCLSLLATGGFAAGEDTVTIDIYSFNDFHGTVDKSASPSNPGADRFVALAQKLMEGNPNSAILSAGDSYQGSSLSNLFLGKPVSDMFKYLGVKYSAVGNHEYDWGSDKFDKFINEGGITFLAANIFADAAGNSPDYCEPYGILEFDEGVKVGIIGLTTTEVPSLVKAENVEGLIFADPENVVAKWEPYLRNEEGCAIVIALTHMGAEEEAADLAKTEAGSKLDGIFSGHVHQWQDIEVNGVKIASAGYNGRGIALLSFKYDKAANKLISVTSKVYLQAEMNDATILPSDPLEVNEDIKKIIEKYKSEAGPLFAKGVGVFGEAIQSREDQAAWATKVVWDYIFGETGDNYILLQNSGGWRDTSPYDRKPNDIVTMNYLYTVMPFDNEIVLMDMKGSDLLADLLSDEAEVTGEKCIEGAYQKDGKWFLTVSGNEILNDDTIYKVACNDFMLTGGDHYDFSNAIDAFFMGVPLRDAMIKVLMDRAGLSGQLDPPYMNDLVPAAWYMEAVAYTVENGIMTGTGVFIWGPQLTVNRATAFTTLYKLEGSPEANGEKFSDVKETDWFYSASLWAKNTGVSEGEGGLFVGNRNITRTELAAIFVRYLELKGYELDPVDLGMYIDEGDIPAWAVTQNVMAKIVGTTIIKGKSDTELVPNATATRAELAQMLLNMANCVDDL